MKLARSKSVALVCRSDTALLPVIRCLGIGGYKVYLIHTCPVPYALKSRYVVGSYSLPSLEPTDAWMDHLQTIKKRFHIVGILPLDEYAARNLLTSPPSKSDSIPTVPLPSLETFEMAIHKGRLGRFLEQNHLPIPRTCFPTPETDPVATALESLQLPILVKATQLAFGQGLYFCHTESELRRAVDEMQQRRCDFILQKLLNGSDLDFSFYAEKGEILAYTIQRGIVPGKPGQPPKKIRVEHHPALFELMKRMVSALKWSGIAHVDTLIEDATQQIHILEINARFWGTILGSTAAGVNFPAYMARRLQGLKEELPSFNPVDYEAGGIGPRWWIHFLRNGRNRKIKTAFPYFLRDPKPELSAWINQRKS